MGQVKSGSTGASVLSKHLPEEVKYGVEGSYLQNW